MAIGMANEEWLRTLEIVRTKGINVAPRGLINVEVRHHTVKFKMSHPIVHERSRKLSYTFMAAEALWILHGSDELDFHREIRSKLEPYSDDLVRMNGAYGIPFNQQIRYVLEKLHEDRDTRQAVMTLWRPNPKPSKDIPCTVAMQFLVRHDVLHCSVFMRSSDVWMGLPYDMFSFTMMAKYVAEEVSAELGNCAITAGSSHLYQKDFAGAEDVLYRPRLTQTVVELKAKMDVRPLLWQASEASKQTQALEMLLNWFEEEKEDVTT